MIFFLLSTVLGGVKMLQFQYIFIFKVNLYSTLEED